MIQTTEILNDLWIDDDGFIASGSGDTYLTVADCDCNHLDIDDREQIKDEIVKRCNQFPKLEKQNAEYIEALREIVDILNRLDNQRWFAALVERDLQLANHVSDLLSKAEKLVAK